MLPIPNVVTTILCPSALFLKGVHTVLLSRLFLNLAVAGLALAATGCTSGSTPNALAAARLPRGGAPISDTVWAAADAEKPEVTIRPATSNLIIGAPFVSRKRWFEINPERNGAEASDFSMITVGLPYQYIPLQFSFSKYLYQRGQPQPVGKLERRFNPFWSSVKTTGDVGDNIDIDVKGIPLIAEWGREKGFGWYFDDFIHSRNDAREFKFIATLWWLGPTWYNVASAERKADGRLENFTGNYFTPLLLGKALGFVLFTTYQTRTWDDQKDSNNRAYGPLMGYAGYYHYQTTTQISQSESKTDARRYVLGGALWYDGTTRHTESANDHTVHGPLWGLFGGGVSRGRPTAYLLRIPIRF